MTAELYDCQQCPGYCCAYPVVEVTRKDVQRIAKHLRKTEQQIDDEYTSLEENPKLRCLRLTPDALFKAESCIFLDKQTRQCKIYASRPEICRDHPGDRCEWYDRKLIEEAIAKGRKVIMLKVLPWTIDADYPLYGAERVSGLLEAYAHGDGTLPGPTKTRS